MIIFLLEKQDLFLFFIFQIFYQENVCMCVYLKLEKVISLKRDPNDLKN